jgi:integrase
MEDYMTVANFLKTTEACNDARQWAKESKPRTLKSMWETCPDASWMTWALRKIGYNDQRKYRLFACACARSTPLADGRTTWDLLEDERSRTAIEVAERFAVGDASESERAAARSNPYTAAAYAAYSAYAAAYATAAYATADARKAANQWQADKLRELITWDEVKAVLDKWASNE